MSNLTEADIATIKEYGIKKEKLMRKLENIDDMVVPIITAAVKRNDTDELNELIRVLPSSFWRAELRGMLMKEGRFKA